MDIGQAIMHLSKQELLSVASIANVAVKTSCNIKSNISAKTGERIYRMPGQTYYDKTVINLSKGERWFCSEAEAISAGWRKSKL